MIRASELPAEHASEDASGEAGARAVRLGLAEVRLKGMGQYRQGHALQPDRSGPGQHHDVVAVLAEHAVRDAGKSCRLEAHGRVEGPDMTGVDAQALAGGELVGRDLSGELDPGRAVALEALEEEALPTEDGAAEGLLHGDGRRDVRRPAQPAVAMDYVLRSRCDLDGEDPPGKLGCKDQHAWAARRLVAGEEDSCSGGDPLQSGHEAALATGVGGLAELHVRGHPGEIAMGRDNGLAGVEDHLEHRENRPLHFGLHLKTPLSSHGHRRLSGRRLSLPPVAAGVEEASPP